LNHEVSTTIQTSTKQFRHFEDVKEGGISDSHGGDYGDDSFLGH
jgi:hypothetical protein